MADTFHFLAREQFGVVSLQADGSAVVLLPMHGMRPFRYEASQIAKHAGKIPGDEQTRTWHGICQLLALASIRLAPDDLQKPVHAPGAYCPRIWRGIQNSLDPLACYLPIHARRTYGSAYVDSITAARSLFAQLTELFRTVQPASINSTTYGHRLRELLILACTELEACWRGVWSHNQKQGEIDRRLTTSDYVKLLEPLRLNEWSVDLTDYPEYGPLSPFEQWSAAAPTKTLPWYDAYNSVKHDREVQFQEASLGNVLAATAALHIELAAQWGPGTFSPLFDALPSPFQIRERPQYSAAEIYAPRFEADLSMHWHSTPWFVRPGEHE